MTISEQARFNVAILNSTGTTDVNSPPISMAGFDGICFVAAINGVLAGSTEAELALQPLLGPTTAIQGRSTAMQASYVCTTGDVGGALVFDIKAPRHAYVGVRLVKPTTHHVSADVIAIRYVDKYRPVTQSTADVLAASVAIGPTT